MPTASKFLSNASLRYPTGIALKTDVPSFIAETRGFNHAARRII